MKRPFLAGCAVVLGLAVSAEAYVGPGVGVTMIGWFAGCAVVVGAALWAAVRLPLRWLIARLRPTPPETESPGEHQD